MLKIENITKRYDGKIAVSDLSLKVPKGVICGVIGPNGAGKTTTIRMIMNITMPDEGKIIFEQALEGQDYRNNIGYLPEERGLYKKMTCSETITYMAALKNYNVEKADTKIDYWLEKLELSEYKDKNVEELSKGMQQKLQFITTIIHEPDLIILDEIFSGLDPLNMELIKNILLELKEKGKTILFSTHVMEQAEKLCDEICMISNGKKVLNGSLKDIKSGFGKNRMQLSINGSGHFIQELPGVKEMIEFNNYIELKLKDNVDSNQLIKSIMNQIEVRMFSMVEPSLYEIFIDQAKINPDEYLSSEAKS